MSSVLDDPRVAQCSDVEFWVSMPDGVWKVRWVGQELGWRAYPPEGSSRTGYGLESVEAVINNVLTWPGGPR